MLNKKTAHTLKSVTKLAGTAAGIGLCFTPVGSVLGLSGLAAAGADIVGGSVISKVGGKVIKGATHGIDRAIDSNTKHAAGHAIKGRKGLVAGGLAGAGIGNMLLNSRGRSLSPTLSALTSNLKSMQQDSDKNRAKDFAKAGIEDPGREETAQTQAEK